MKRSAVERKRNSFSIDSIIGGSRTTEASPAPTMDTRVHDPSTHLPLLSRSIPRNTCPSDRALQAMTAAVSGMVYDEREVMRQRSVFDYGRYANYDHAAAQFAAAAAAMASMASCPAAVDASVRAMSDRVNYTHWMHANRQHTSPALFLPGKRSHLIIYTSFLTTVLLRIEK